MYKKVILISLIIGLSLSNFYFYSKIEKLDYAIIIGTPSGNGSTVERTDLSKPLSNKDEVNVLIFSLIESVSIDKPNVSINLPDSIIFFNDWDDGISYSKVNLWEDENSIIFATNVNSDAPLYKKLVGDRATDLRNIIGKYKIKN